MTHYFLNHPLIKLNKQIFFFTSNDLLCTLSEVELVFLHSTSIISLKSIGLPVR